MFCDQCGAELPDDSVFCPKCGARLTSVDSEANNAAGEAAPEAANTAGAVNATGAMNTAANAAGAAGNAAGTANNTTGNGTGNSQTNMTNVSSGTPAAEPPKKKKGFPFVPVILIGIVLVAVIVVVAIFLPKGKTKDGIEFSEKNLMYNGSSFFTTDGKELEVNNVDTLAYNYDNSVVAYLTTDDTLYVIDSELTPVEIENDVLNMEVSYSGSSIAYTVGADYTATTLYVYNVKKDNSEKIDTDVYAYNYLVSPNGKQVAYLKDYEGNSDNTLYVAVVGKDGKKVDKDGCIPLAIGDNGKSFFYTDNSDSSNVKLYWYNGKDAEKISRDVSGSYYFNNNVSEILFTKSGNTYFYRIGMDEPSKVAGDALIGMWNYKYETTAQDYTFGNQSSGVLVNRSKLTEWVFATEDDICYLNKDGKDSAKLCDADGISNITVAQNGKSLIYLKDGKLYKITKFGADREETELYEGDVYINGYVAGRDLSNIYVVSDEAELYYCKSKKKLVKISNDFANRNNMAYNEASKTIFYIEDENLYSAGKSGKKKELVAENVTDVVNYADGILYMVTEDGVNSYYYVKKGEPVKIMED